MIGIRGRNFLEAPWAGGVVLLGCVIVAMLLANLPGTSLYYRHLLETDLSLMVYSPDGLIDWVFPRGMTVEKLINDGLMVIFFFAVGLEIKREIVCGQLSSARQAILPVLAAAGGMLAPAIIFLFFNHGTIAANGWGIPTATDIAFAIGILSLLGDRVPFSLKVFLTALAVIDDLGAIFTIAVFYSGGIQWAYFGGAMGIFAVLLALNRLKVFNLIPYLTLGAVMWWFMLHSGVHATVTGVLVAFAIPFGDGKPDTISWKLQHFLHKPVAFIIMPLFALANTCIVLGSDWYEHLLTLNSYGIFLGLVVGKPFGITLFCAAAIGLGLCTLPTGISWKKLFGVACLAGIGFTMSLFIGTLAFDDPAAGVGVRVGVLLGSLVAALAGWLWLRMLPSGGRAVSS